MKIIKLETGPLITNTYIVFDEKTTEAIVIDPGGDEEKIQSVLEKENLKLKLIIATHLHFDHILAVEPLLETNNTKFCYNQKEEEININKLSFLLEYLGVKIKEIPKADFYVRENDEIRIGRYKLKVLETPGHTPGSISLLSNGVIFTGDLIFREGVGRTDFPGGDWKLLKKSIIEKVYTLPDDYVIYPGHGPITSVGYEKRNNFFVRL